MRFDLADLSLFRHVVEAGSITHGAERAHLALAAASTRIRNMEEALGAALLVRGRPGRHADPGRAHAAAACARDPAPGRAAARGPRRLCGRARRADPGALEHQCAHRIPARGAELVPGRPSACQRRPRGAAERRDRRPDRRRRRRSRHRRRHGRCERARDLSVPQGPLRAGGGARPSARQARRRSPSRRCSTTISSGLDRASALQRFLADKAARVGQPLRLRVQLRSFDAVCRLVECNVGIGIVPETTARRVARTMAIAVVTLTDPWAVRELTICIRSLDELPPYARQLVEHLRADAALSVSARHQHPIVELEQRPRGRPRRRSCAGNRRTAGPWWRSCAAAARPRRRARAAPPWPAPPTRRTRSRPRTAAPRGARR